MNNKLVILFLGLVMIITAAIVIIKKPNNEEKNISQEVEMEIATIPEKMESDPDDMISYQQGEITILSDESSIPQEMENNVSEESSDQVVVVPSVGAIVPQKND